MKQIHVITAILLTIKDFGINTFSIHNITAAIRDDLNFGEYELENGDTRLPHDTVKRYFMELWDNGILFKYDRNYNSLGYWEYTRKVNTQVPSAPTNVSVTAAVTNAVNSAIIDKDVQLKIYNYLKSNGPSNMKRIQSRLKGYNYTCKELKDFLNSLGLIDPQSSNSPDSQTYTIKF